MAEATENIYVHCVIFAEKEYNKELKKIKLVYRHKNFLYCKKI